MEAAISLSAAWRLPLSAALKADAVESAVCGYMAWIALAGLEVNAISGKSWADASREGLPRRAVMPSLAIAIHLFGQPR